MAGRGDFSLEHYRGQHGSHLRLRTCPEAFFQACCFKERHRQIVVFWKGQSQSDWGCARG